MSIEKMLNEMAEINDLGYEFGVHNTKDEIILTVADSESNLVYEVSTIKADDLEVITQLIDQMYKKYINDKNRKIKKFRGFCENKIKQLEKSLLNNDKLKVEYIQKCLIEERKNNSILKYEVQEAKEVVQCLFRIKNELEGV